MTVLHIAHPSLEERSAHGAQARAHTPLDSHLGWRPAADRPDPVALLEEQNRTRDADLVPVRHGRMMASPFTFYRGAAKVMAADLAGSPTAGLDCQLCGDAHLSNFGVDASPERTLMFDCNDFDETLPGPFEYDLKRLAASFTVAARNSGHSSSDARSAAQHTVRAYREAITQFAQMGTLDLWYAHLAESDITASFRDTVSSKSAGKNGKTQSETQRKAAKQVMKTYEKNLRKTNSRNSLQALSKLAEQVDGRYQIVSQPPVVVPARELGHIYGFAENGLEEVIHQQFRAYRATLQLDRRRLLERFEVVDVARKVVGVGSVGTRAFIVLLQGRDTEDPLFLQIKEATASVLEQHLPKSRFKQHGERVVQGQRMMQATSDIFLGWTKGVDVNRHFYWRQLRDKKGSAIVELMSPSTLSFYAQTCGWTLARAHARSGDPVAMASYLGDSDTFDRAIADFAVRYADQNERDFNAIVAAIRAGRLQAVEGV